jgi:hypothetical protein
MNVDCAIIDPSEVPDLRSQVMKSVAGVETVSGAGQAQC